MCHQVSIRTGASINSPSFGCLEQRIMIMRFIHSQCLRITNANKLSTSNFWNEWYGSRLQVTLSHPSKTILFTPRNSVVEIALVRCLLQPYTCTVSSACRPAFFLLATTNPNTHATGTMISNNPYLQWMCARERRFCRQDFVRTKIMCLFEN